jgi:F-type H+-transporting ATPase subunit b|tara:strand:- start:246 stop:821 length:576 start_codon:yes stop_codon:yes gene_type:complete
MGKIFVIILAYLAISINLYAAEAGMPQLDPKYWASQAFWLVLIFTTLHLSVAKIFIPKIKDSLDDRENKIKKDLDEAKNLEDLAKKKQKEYEINLEKTKKEVQKIIFESKNKLDADIKKKRKVFEKEIEKEIENVQNEINLLKKNSIDSINIISQDLTLKIIKEISGDSLNESSVKAAINEVSKENLNKYL